MKKRLLLALTLVITCVSMIHSQNRINITIDRRSIGATLAENAATKALVEKLTDGPVTITMSNYGGFEKVGPLPWSLPTSDTRITTKPGDIMLYTGNSLVIFYGQNTWAYTPIGVLDTSNSSEISAFVGNGDKQVTISLANLDHIGYLSVEADTKERVFALDGKEIISRPIPPGLYIVNNKKVIIR